MGGSAQNDEHSDVHKSLGMPSSLCHYGRTIGRAARLLYCGESYPDSSRQKSCSMRSGRQVSKITPHLKSQIFPINTIVLGQHMLRRLNVPWPTPSPTRPITERVVRLGENSLNGNGT